jgi:site-specific recombinase XerD
MAKRMVTKVTSGRPIVGPELEELIADTRALAGRARAPRTEEAYAGDWAHFAAWSERVGLGSAVPSDAGALLEPVPPAVVALYANALRLGVNGQVFRVSTIERRMAAVSVVHKRSGLPSPTSDPQVREILTAIRRDLRTAPAQKAAATVSELRRMVDRLEQTDLPVSTKLRDRALLLVGYAAALRRSELVALTCGDLEQHDDGLVVIVRTSKTDQEGEGARVPVARGRDAFTCPVRALEAWLAVGCPDGCDGSRPVFRRVDRWGSTGDRALTGRAVAMIVQRAAAAAGLDPQLYAGHSLRAGFATTAAANGATERQIANVTRHRSMNVLRGYIREANLFADSAADKAGL